MGYTGTNPKFNWLELTPQSADPANPAEGDVYRSNGTARPVGLWEYRSSSWQKIGSDVASESLIIGDDATFEGSAGAYATYADAAATQPVDGTGGSPNVTFARTTVTAEIINGAASGKLVKDAANRQGQGLSLTLSVPNKFRGKPVKFSFFYQASANFDYGNFNDFADPSDVIVQAYDVTNAVLLNPAPYQLDGSGYQAVTCQVPTTCASIRLIFHIATTNALAWDFIIDDVALEINENQVISNISDWIDFPSVAAGTLITATTTNPTFGTIAINRAQYRIVGSDMEIRWDFRQTTAGTTGSGTYLINLPAGFRMDLTKVSPNTGLTVNATSVDNQSLGYIFALEGSNGAYNGSLAVHSATQLKRLTAELEYLAGLLEHIWHLITPQWLFLSLQKFQLRGVRLAQFIRHRLG
jgi:hypothetical protein